jgi:hypothetical protein
MGESYTPGALGVNLEDEDRRRRLLAEMDLVRTADLMDALGCSKKTLSILRHYGLAPLGVGKQKVYRLSKVADALEKAAAERRERGDDGEEGDET